MTTTTLLFFKLIPKKTFLFKLSQAGLPVWNVVGLQIPLGTPLVMLILFLLACPPMKAVFLDILDAELPRSKDLMQNLLGAVVIAIAVVSAVLLVIRFLSTLFFRLFVHLLTKRGRCSGIDKTS